jgi:hypothetical protein
MKFKYLLFIIMVSFMTYALVSCNKENEEPDPEPQSGSAILPSVITYSKSASTMPEAGMKTYVIKFEYDAYDRITKMHSEYFIDGIPVNHDFIPMQTFTYDLINNGITTIITRPDAPGVEFAQGEVMTARDIRTAATEKYILVPSQGNGIFRNVKTPAWVQYFSNGQGSYRRG